MRNRLYERSTGSAGVANVPTRERIMVCHTCGVTFAETKADAMVGGKHSYCSESCGMADGWFGTGKHLSQETAATLQELEDVALRVPLDRVWLPHEQQSLDDTLAILTSESGAERRAGPPATVALILAALQELKAQEWYGARPSEHRYAFWDTTLAQIEATTTVLRAGGE